MRNNIRVFDEDRLEARRLTLRLVGLSGVIILIVSIIVSGIFYITARGLAWAPGDMGFIYSSVLTIGFIISIGTGLFGAIRESEEFLILAGTACIVLAVLNKVFTNILYSWSYMEIVFLLAGAIMIMDRFHVRRVKIARKLKEEMAVAPMQKPGGPVGIEGIRVGRGRIFDFREGTPLEVRGTPEPADTWRMKLYHDKDAREIVRRFLSSDLKYIEPEIKTSTKPSYPELADIEKTTTRDLQSILDELAETGVLVGELYEKLITCPRCHQSSKVFLRSKCSKCDSRKVRKNRLVEHTECGAIYKEDEYYGTEGSKCPKCGKTFQHETELEPIGVTYECEACGNVFNDPKQAYYCRNCAYEFQFENCELEDLYSYTLNEKIKPEALEKISVLSVADALEGLGYKTSVPGVLSGRSGVGHEFTLTYSRGERRFAVDLVTSEGPEVNLRMILPSYAKFIDVGAERCLLIAVPRLADQARDYLEANKIPYIEGENPTDVSLKTRHYLESAT
ncbi:MAG: hypothetical protein QXN62_08400 [Candidatus Bathyarchaeia archaeon]|nr:hypothetical protein [Candidatus Bathyarchaeota archaeon]